MRLLTIQQIIDEIKRTDPDSRINRAVLNQLFESGAVPFIMHGNRVIAEYGIFLQYLRQLFKFDESVSVPRIRTISDVAQLLKKQKDASGINENRIRLLLRQDVVPSITIGNRKYIALQSFESPFCERLVLEKPESTVERQIEKIHPVVSIIRRVKN